MAKSSTDEWMAQKAFELGQRHRLREQELQTRAEITKENELERHRLELVREEYGVQVVALEYEGRARLEHMRHQFRQIDRLADFDDFEKREEVAFHQRQLERIEQSKEESARFDRQLLESQRTFNNRLIELGTLAYNQQIQSRQEHIQTMEREEQAHRHRMDEANNASRLNVSEMFSSRFFEYVFSKFGGESAGLSREDLEKIAAEWEKEGDNLKK
jgi:uncharacterized membrane protein